MTPAVEFLKKLWSFEFQHIFQFSLSTRHNHLSLFFGQAWITPPERFVAVSVLAMSGLGLELWVSLWDPILFQTDYCKSKTGIFG